VSPTTSPDGEGNDLFLWGAPEAVGQDVDTDVLAPLFVEDQNAVDASAGTGYSVVVLADGTALVAGVVESIDTYGGHLGLLEGVVEGVNEFRPVGEVYDPQEEKGSGGGSLVAAPLFQRAFAGVANGGDEEPGTGMHSVLLDRRGRAWAFGSNGSGQLCLGDDADRYAPELVVVDDGVRIVDVAVGGEHTLLLDELGNVYGCGSDAVGQLGLGGGGGDVGITMIYASPTLVEVGSSEAFVSSVSAGLSHSLFTAEDDDGGVVVYFTGSNEYGQLCADTGGEDVTNPTALDVDERVAISLEAIRESSYILYEDGSVGACGRNDFGQLGDGTNVDSNTDGYIVAVETDEIVVRLLGAGPSAQSVFFVADDDIVYGTGLNDRGQLGVGDTDDRNVPTTVLFGPGVIVDSISAGGSHALALGTKTEVDTPGPSTYPPTESPVEGGGSSTALPTGSPEAQSDTPSPTASPFPTMSPTTFDGGSPVTSIPTMFPTESGDSSDMYYWGASGSAGQAQSEDVASPLDSATKVTDVSAGSGYSIVVLPDGTAQSGGFVEAKDNYQGHLGLRGGDISEGDNPFQTISSVFDSENQAIVDAPFFVRAYAGAENQLASPGTIHSVLIDAEGQAWTTGSNAKGQLCLGDDEDRLIPQQVPIDGYVVGAAIGGEHTLLLLEDGSVYGCGSNDVGQLGLGADVPQANIPTQVQGLGSVESMSAGLGFSLFKSADGLFVTGSNFYGQLCVDSNVGGNVLSPELISDVAVEGVSTFEAIKTSSFILFNDGSVGACGRNNFGQLGDGSEEDRVRTVIEPLPGEVAMRGLGVGPSSESAFFVNDDGVTYATGLNDRGQLGVGDFENRNALTEVDWDIVDVGKISASGDHTLSR